MTPNHLYHCKVPHRYGGQPPQICTVDPPLQWLTLLLPVCLVLAKGVIELSGEGLMSCLTSSFCVLKSLPSMKMLVSLCKCSYLGDLVQRQQAWS